MRRFANSAANKGLIELSRQALRLLQCHIETLGLKAAIHFELEGCFRPRNCHTGKQGLDYAAINRTLKTKGIAAQLKPEYWQNQWEYVSLFAGQTPMQEADNLALAIDWLPTLLAQHGAADVFIKPIVWRGDRASLEARSDTILNHGQRDIHIPNAVQLNLSVWDKQGNNLMAEGVLGERVQQALLRTSYPCSLLFLPEEEAFVRLRLRSDFGLDRELSSPVDLSGGHQGSIALYRERGKHNQPQGVETILLDAKHNALLSRHEWKQTSRIEHRLGAASRHYMPHLNVVFALANLLDVLLMAPPHGELDAAEAIRDDKTPKTLPTSILSQGGNKGALQLFAESSWLAQTINRSLAWYQALNTQQSDYQDDLGEVLKQAVIAYYRDANLSPAVTEWQSITQ